MPADTAIQAAEQFRAAVLSKQRASLVRLVNGYGAMYQRLQVQIDALTAEIDAMALKGDVTPWKVGKLDRLEALKRQIATEATRYGALVEGEIDAGAREMVAQAQKDAKAIARAALPGVQQIDAAIMTQWQSLNPEAVQSLLGFLSDESPMRDYLRTKFGPELSNVVSSKMLESIGLGYNPRKLASALRQATGQGLDWSLRTARTAQLYAYREGSRAAYAANPDVVKGWKWLSARTSNTCMACIAQDGTTHKVTESLNDHYNGKCAMLPVTVTYRELGLDVDEPPSALEHVTGEDWFKAQPEAVQRQMMGPAKHDAWKSGKVPFDRLTTEHTDPVYGKMKQERSLKDILGGDGPEGGAGAPVAPKPSPAAPTRRPTIKAEGQASELLNELPDEARQLAQQSGLREIKVLNKRDYNREIAGDKSVRPGWESVAVYRNDGTLLLRADNPNLRKTFYHEFAHSLDPLGSDANYALSEHPDWLKASGWKQSKTGKYSLRPTITNRPTSEYGQVSPWEDFAESFTKYTTGSDFDRRVMQGESAGRYDYMAKFVSNLGIKVP